MRIRSLASIMALLSLVWAGIGLWIVRQAFQPSGEPEDAVVLFGPMLILSLVGCTLSLRSLRTGDGAAALATFAAFVAVSFGTYVALAPIARYSPWTTTDTVTWLMAALNVILLALVSWRLSQLARAQRQPHDLPLLV